MAYVGAIPLGKKCPVISCTNVAAARIKRDGIGLITIECSCGRSHTNGCGPRQREYAKPRNSTGTLIGRDVPVED